MPAESKTQAGHEFVSLAGESFGHVVAHLQSKTADNEQFRYINSKTNRYEGKHQFEMDILM